MVMPTLAAPRLVESFETANQGLIDTQIDSLDIRASNIHLMLSRLSAATKIPVGLEVSPNDDLLVNRDMKLQIQKELSGQRLTRLSRRTLSIHGSYKMAWSMFFPPTQIATI